MAGYQFQRHQPQYRSKKVLALYLSVLIVAIGSVIFGTVYTNNKVDLNNVEIIKRNISKHMVLPTNEQPALATVTDHSKLSTAFLKKTLNGDKLLIYQTNREVIIYRPSIDRIIDVGPVNIDTPQSTSP